METILLKRRADEDGTVTFSVPPSLRDKELELLVVMQPLPVSVIAESEKSVMMDQHGWPSGFFEETFGSLASLPIERPPQGEYEIREPIE